ncbi:hypothetical protein [Nostoc sp. ChiVER01]|uniref:hypothetical protein n=1 Tax=Nostoc sp. ChiVER01 TaxID=3075382 RepID=UPI002AD385FE|nr:hypothetical protein [Nostoc sp. ChiVER01]MDZ8227549.1 hypothetical protein [Nostoc sp. ChiVER01]
MKIETITYRRVKNLGNYNTEAMELTATLEDEDLPEDVAENLKLFVRNQLFPPVTEQDDLPEGF